MRKVFTAIFLSLVLILPQAAQAQSQDSCGKLRAQFEKYGGNFFGSLPQYCSTGEILTKIVSLALTLIGALTVIGVMYGGILYITSGGNEAAAKKGKQVAFYSVLGLVVVIMASLVVTLISRVVVDNTLF